MVCLLVTVFLTFVGGLITGLVIAAPLTTPAVFGFLYSQIPIAKLATVETFLEGGLLIYFIFTSIFTRKKFIKNICIIAVIFLTGIAFYISFRSKIVWTQDIPVLGDLYSAIFHFFSGILKKINVFFTGN